MRSPWPARVVLLEAYRNGTSRPIRLLALVVAFGAILAIAGMTEANTLSQIGSAAARFQVAGFDVAIAFAGEERLSAAECSALVHLSGVERSGWLLRDGTAQAATSPGVSYAKVLISPELPTIWIPDWLPATRVGTNPGVVLGPLVARDLGMSSGSTISLTGLGSVSVANVLPSSARGDDYERWIMFPSPPLGEADECWVEFVPGHSGPAMNVLRSFLASAEPEMVARLVRLDELTDDPDLRVNQRVSRHLWWASGACVVLVLWLIAWQRRGEWALYRVLGRAGPS